MVTEVKVCIMSFQMVPPGVSPFEIICARPQSNNECSEFTDEMEEAAKQMMTSIKGVSCTNFAVDGVSLESFDVMHACCEFLDGKSIILGTTDPNHNAKTQRYQIIGAGSGVVSVGNHIVDSDLLHQAGIASDLIHPCDFASDLLVQQLTGFDTITKLYEAMADGTAKGMPEDAAAMGATLLFLRLPPHAVNGKQVKARHRAVYIWEFAMWMLPLSGLRIITKRVFGL